MPRWKFLTNHALVLCAIARQPRITVREIALAVGITEKASRNIIADLEADGYVTKKRVGRRIRYHIHPDLPLRHEMEQDKAASDLLDVFGRKRRRVRQKVA